MEPVTLHDMSPESNILKSGGEIRLVISGIDIKGCKYPSAVYLESGIGDEFRQRYKTEKEWRAFLQEIVNRINRCGVQLSPE